MDRAELKAIASDEKEKEYRFGGELEFGTAGMRGIIGCGMNMMNVYTVMRATQGLSEYIKTLPAADQAKGVVISYDTRRKEEIPACLPRRRRACSQRTASRRISSTTCIPCPCSRMRCVTSERSRAS